MSQIGDLLKTLKSVLRRQRITYADLARGLQLSEASVKRLFSRGDMPISRLGQICRAAGLTLAELVELAADNASPLSQLTIEQEHQLADNPKLLLVTYLALNRWQFEQILEVYQIDRHELVRLLAQLEKLGILQLLPLNRIRLLTGRNFTWRRDGPIQQIYTQQIQREFFESSFDQPLETLVFMAAALSERSLATLRNSIEALAREFDTLAEKDQKAGLDVRMSTAAVFAVRPVEFSLFSRYKRVPAKGS